MEFLKHVVISGDTVSQLAYDNGVTVNDIMSANPVVFNAARLVQQARYIDEGKLVVDGVLIFPGDVLNIPAKKKLSSLYQEKQLINLSDLDPLAIFVDGKKIDLSNSFNLSMFYDSCSNSFSFSNPLDYDVIDFDIDSFSNGLPNIQIYLFGKKQLDGQIEKRSISIGSTSASHVFAGRTRTRLAEKSAIMPNTQMTFKNMSILAIGELVLSPFGIKLTAEDLVLSDASTPITKVTRNDGETPFNFISRIAKDFKIIVSSNDNQLVLKRFELIDSVATFVINSSFLEFVGLESININYDSTGLFGSYIGKLQVKGKDNISKTVDSNYLDEISTQVKSFENIKESQLSAAIAWDEQKVIKNFYNNTIPYPSWVNPNSGELWSPGQVVEMVIENLNVKNLSLMIKNVIFKYDGKGVRTCELTLIPIETYL